MQLTPAAWEASSFTSTSTLMNFTVGVLSFHGHEDRCDALARAAPCGGEVDDDKAFGTGDDLIKLSLRVDLVHTTAETQHEVECRLLLDVVVRKGAAILELLAGEDQPLLVRGDALLVLDLGLDVVNGVGALDLERDGLACQCLDEDLHATAETQHEVECRLLLGVVVRQSAAILELLAGEDQPLLVRGDALLVL